MASSSFVTLWGGWIGRFRSHLQAARVRTPFLTACFWGLALLAAASYLRWPLGSDVSIHFTGLHQGLLRGDGFARTWTFRGPVYNAYLMVLYRAATCFVPFSDVRGFSLLVKWFHLVALIPACFVFGLGLARRLPGFRGFGLALTGLALAGVLSATANNTLQAEDVAVLILLFALGFGARESAAALVAAGALAALLPLLKGSTSLLCLTALLVVPIARARRVRALALWSGGYIVTLGAQALWCRTAGKLAWMDLLDAATFQKSGYAPLVVRNVRLSIEWPSFLEFMPMLGAALVTVGCVLGYLAARRRFFELAFLVLGGGMSFLIVYVQHKYFEYHPGTVIPIATIVVMWFVVIVHARLRHNVWWGAILGGAITAIFLCFETDHPFFFDHELRRVLLIAGCFSATLLVARGLGTPRGRAISRLPARAAFAIPIFAMALFPWAEADKGLATGARIAQRDETIRRTEENTAHWRETFALENEEVLYLSYGNVIRYLGARSACRHFFPIPVQRYFEETAEKFEAAPGFRENRDCILGYRGRYVVYEKRWMKGSDLQDKLLQPFLRNYRAVKQKPSESDRVKVYERIHWKPAKKPKGKSRGRPQKAAPSQPR